MRASTNITALNNKLTILMGITMMTACSGFLAEIGSSRSVSNEMMMKEGKVNGLHNWRFHQNHLPSYPQNHHPLSHAMTRNKVSIEPRIVNGIDVNPPDKYSFMGSLRILEPLHENHICGVTLITRTIVLSVAHCYYDPNSDYYVTFGDYDYNDSDVGDSYKVKKFRLHEDYDERQIHNDMMLMELEDAVDEKYDVMSLNNGSVFDVESYSGSVVATGWGRVEYEGERPSHLLETSLPLLSPQSCDDYLNSEVRLNSSLISSYDSRGKLCAGGDGITNVCHGDSGGPIFYVNTTDSPSPQYLQLGIASFIVSLGVDCALAGYPSVYTDVEYYYGWIQDVLCSGDDFEGTNTSSFYDDILGVNPSASPSPYSVPGLSPACVEEVIELADDEELNAAIYEVRDRVNCDSTISTCTFSDSDLEFVRDACNESNGTFYSIGYSLECSGDSVTYTNYPWCTGRSCTFDEYFEFLFSYLSDGCTLETYPSVSDSLSPSNYPPVSDSASPSNYPSVSDSLSPSNYPSVSDSASPSNYYSAIDSTFPSNVPSASDVTIPFSNRLIFGSGIIMMLLYF